MGDDNYSLQHQGKHSSATIVLKITICHIFPEHEVFEIACEFVV